MNFNQFLTDFFDRRYYSVRVKMGKWPIISCVNNVEGYAVIVNKRSGQMTRITKCMVECYLGDYKKFSSFIKRSIR